MHLTFCSCVPILDDVKAVQFSRTKREALISFEGKVSSVDRSSTGPRIER